LTCACNHVSKARKERSTPNFCCPFLLLFSFRLNKILFEKHSFTGVSQTVCLLMWKIWFLVKMNKMSCSVLKKNMRWFVVYYNSWIYIYLLFFQFMSMIWVYKNHHIELYLIFYTWLNIINYRRYLWNS